MIDGMMIYVEDLTRLTSQLSAPLRVCAFVTPQNIVRRITPLNAFARADVTKEISVKMMIKKR
jgi:hypothetical protein